MRAGADAKRVAPFTADEVASLNAFQMSGCWHPFTGRNDLAPEHQDDVLVATEAGWVSQLDPSYRQNWCHAWMADWSWRDIFAANIALLANAPSEQTTSVSDDTLRPD